MATGPKTRQESAALQSNGSLLRTLLVKQIVPLLALGVIVGLLIHNAAALDAAQILDAAQNIQPAQWLVAGLATWLSFIIYGRYEGLIHRLTGTGIETGRARLGGIGAMGVSQLTGFGLLVGTLARWRMFPDLSLWQAIRLTAMVTFTFMPCLAVLMALGLVFTDIVSAELRALSAVGLLGAALLLVWVSLWRPRRLFRLPLPSLAAMVRLLALTAADTALAALALYVLLPPDIAPPIAAYYAVFVLALGLGLLSSTPGGVGPFEFLCLSLLPSIPESDLLAAIMGYRLVYYGLPAVFGTAVLIFAPLFRRSPRRHPYLEPALEADGAPPLKAEGLSFTAYRAEAGLMRQGGYDILHNAQEWPLAMVGKASQSLIMLTEPLIRSEDRRATITDLSKVARDSLRVPCLYKCGARTAVAARALGWTVLAVSDEAWLRPENFHTGGPEHRQLRRHLRKAETAGITVTAVPTPSLPLDEMQALATNWEMGRGGARGFSMGRFDPDYVKHQKVYCAYDRCDRLRGFITLHDAAHERTLDLMCHDATAPTGCMQALLAHAIEGAADDGIERLSLAAVPRTWDLPGRLTFAVERRTGSNGLRRFKESFSPHWETLYVAAPNRFALAIAALDLFDQITRPRRHRP